MRRLAFVLLASLIVGLSSAGPAQGYWSLFHSPHHLPLVKPHHPHHGATGPVQPITPGQVIGAIQLGQQLLGPLFHQPNPTPAPEPRVSAATSAQITATGTAVNKAADNANALLELVRKADTRHDKKTLPDVPHTGGGGGGAPTPGAGTTPTPGGGGGAPRPSDGTKKEE